MYTCSTVNNPSLTFAAWKSITCWSCLLHSYHVVLPNRSWMNKPVDYSKETGGRLLAYQSKILPTLDPNGLKPAEDGPVDVFFLYPTSFLDKRFTLWNASIDNQKINKAPMNPPLNTRPVFSIRWVGFMLHVIARLTILPISLLTKPMQIKHLNLHMVISKCFFNITSIILIRVDPIIIAGHKPNFPMACNWSRIFLMLPFRPSWFAAYLQESRFHRDILKH